MAFRRTRHGPLFQALRPRDRERAIAYERGNSTTWKGNKLRANERQYNGEDETGFRKGNDELNDNPRESACDFLTSRREEI